MTTSDTFAISGSLNEIVEYLNRRFSGGIVVQEISKDRWEWAAKEHAVWGTLTSEVFEFTRACSNVVGFQLIKKPGFIVGMKTVKAA